MDMRGSGIYSTQDEIAIDPCTVCGTHEGWACTDDWGRATLECENGHEQPMPDYEPDYESDPDWG